MYYPNCVCCGKEWPKGANGRDLQWPAAGTQWTTYCGYPFRSDRNPVPEMKFYGEACERCSGIIGTHFGSRYPDHPDYSISEYIKIAVQYQLMKSI